ncbi:MAG: exopolysaccharide biosynthesis polyprenyl glycosylphosphotransferase [Hyphomonas sp.]|nr:exopolysaccharide biosynthesis polyprenyl glycosylphosphotransferase [Hyphomonas sp.]MBU3921510.1 exopolysaccharide biosynthesis polyprenyl glycosylphosphotransferase [Alphaproteobacteria bacterium]MBU4060327.1 exopolysaccharide biosynthesis polyprenyl glycosylphosphotransferase [Alphaproteobacteria bacterium]MBU4162995.1 exopolysaccharide biosynthesis polyprenyl glycosylphosphotransferase [Alphaproteobacteria bacterium]
MRPNAQIGPQVPAKAAVSARLPVRRRLGHHRSRIAAAVLPAAGRWSATAATILCAAAFLPAGLNTPLAAALPLLALPFATLIALQTSNAFEFSVGNRATDRTLPAALGLGAILVLLCAASLTVAPVPQEKHVIRAAGAAFTLSLLIQMVTAAAYDWLRRRGLFNETVVIVGATDKARSLIARNAASRELDILGVFDDRLSRAPSDIAGVPVIGRIDDLLSWDQLPHVDRIIVSVSSEARVRVRSLIDRLRILPQKVVLLLDLEAFGGDQQTLAQIARSPAAYVCGAPENIGRAIIKRLSDLVFGVAMLVVFSPILLLLALAIRLDSPGPVLFRQRRHGFNNRIIRVWKFRSMREDRSAEHAMTSQAIEDDPRITRVGRFIRSTSLDELPQLFNVLKGEMSIVGPRPHALGMTAEQTEVYAIVGDYAHRHRVKPGITGWAQINGSRGPVHTKEEVRERIRLDLEYVNRSSFWLDLYIMLMTAPCLLGDRQQAR